MHAMSVVATEDRDLVRVVRLNRPEALNAIDTTLRRTLIGALEAADQAPGIGAIVITGSGSRGFCSGQDLSETSRYTLDDIEAWLAANHAMYRAVRDLARPVVAAFNGVAAGAGFQIGLCCDLRVGYPEMKIGQPEIKAGLASIVGSQMMTSHVGFGHNVELSLLGDLITGQRAYEMGLLNRLVPQDEVLDTAVELAARLARLPSTAMRLTKERFRRLSQPGFDAALDAAVAAQKAAYESGEPQTAMRRFLASRRNPGSESGD
ncbi:MAG: enoyl-CoA hydratase/isomerase family protein [Betaproteobacteria bacterium]|nr:enoyl-CoA hydratase/isomerase family protein [Betaproteobacteria bacterium]